MRPGSEMAKWLTIVLPVWVSIAAYSPAHENLVADLPTYQITAPAHGVPEPKLRLHINEMGSGEPTAARFTLEVDGEQYVPDALGSNGLRFVSIHQAKKQRQVFTYARGAGPVEVPLPAGAHRVVVRVTKGFEFLPCTHEIDVTGATTDAGVWIKRWINLAEEGWLGCDEHLHYGRPSRAYDSDWLTMMAADDLAHMHFMTLKGANIPGIWADQFAYGKAGEASDGKRLIRPGEEYRDPLQGHINLLGINEVIPPISSGGLGDPPVPYNFPPLYDVFMRTRQLGGIGGIAHGSEYSGGHTAIVATVLGALDFFEITNTHLLKTDMWYRLMNCGYIVPPAAGTDLPNFPYRDAWQPFLGEVRMYVKLGEKRDFEPWKAALLRGEVFITSGPLLRFSINGVGPGGTLRLPAEGGEVTVQAELASPLKLKSLEVVRNGLPLPLQSDSSTAGPVHRLSIQHSLKVTSSCWMAARGMGIPKQALEENLGIKQDAHAHTAAIRVLVGEQPIQSVDDARALVEYLVTQKNILRTRGKYERVEDLQYVQDLSEKAIRILQGQANEIR